MTSKPDTSELGSPLNDLMLGLWVLRERLDGLIYRCEINQLVLASARTQLGDRALGEVVEAWDFYREAENLLPELIADFAEEVGGDPDLTLSQLVELAPQDAREALSAHIDELRGRLNHLNEVLTLSSELAGRGLAATADILGTAGIGEAGTDTYTQAGEGVRLETASPRIIRTV